MPLYTASVAFNPFTPVAMPELTTQYPVHLLPDKEKLGRTEVEHRFQKNGLTYVLYLRDKAASEDWLLSSAKATAFALRRGEEYRASPPDIGYRNALIKKDVVI